MEARDGLPNPNWRSGSLAVASAETGEGWKLPSTYLDWDELELLGIGCVPLKDAIVQVTDDVTRAMGILPRELGDREVNKEAGLVASELKTASIVAGSTQHVLGTQLRGPQPGLLSPPSRPCSSGSAVVSGRSLSELPPAFEVSHQHMHVLAVHLAVGVKVLLLSPPHPSCTREVRGPPPASLCSLHFVLA